MDASTRRTFVRTAGVAATLALAGCSSGASNPSDGSDGSDGAGGGDGSSDGSDGAGGGDGSSGDGGSGRTETDVVEMTDELVFAPADIRVEQGTTVTWKNVGSIGHSVTAYEDRIPDGAEYFASGGFDSEDAANEAYPDEGNVTEGGTYEHTFETTGTYEYYCIPHEMNGMVGSIEVV